MLFSLFKYLFIVIGLIPIVMILILINLLLLLAFVKIASKVIKKVSKSKFRSAITAGQEDLAKNPYFTVGILHPFCNSGGGGERVLWSAVKALQDK